MKNFLSAVLFIYFAFSYSAAFSDTPLPPSYGTEVYQGSKYGLTNIRKIYIDKNQNLWVINFNNDTSNPFDIIVISSTNPSARPITYKGAEYQLGIIYGIVFDESGNAWIAKSQDISGNNPGLVEIPSSPPSKPIIYSGPAYNFKFLNFPMNPLAADPSGNIWVINAPNGPNDSSSLTKIPANNPNSPIVYHADSVYQFYLPLSITSDLKGNIWIANSGAPDGKTYSILEIPAKNSSNPIIYKDTKDTKYGFYRPLAITADSQNNIWVLSSGKGNVTEIPEGTQAPKLFPSDLFTSIIPSVFTTDVKGNIWTSNSGLGNLIELPIEYTAPAFQYDPNRYSLSRVAGFVTDKLGNIWVANNGNNTITELVRKESAAK